VANDPPIIPTTLINMLMPVINPAFEVAVEPSWLPDGEGAPPPVVVVAGGRAAEVAGVVAVGVGLLTTGVGDEGVVGAGGLETAGDLHWLTGGVEILQAPGRVRARVWLTGIPTGLLVVVKSWQRQAAFVLTTEARAVQQPCVGLLLLGPPCKKVRHGAKLTREAVHDDEELGGVD